MSVSLILTRAYDDALAEAGLVVHRDEWLALVASDPDLRLRTSDYETVNPRSGERIHIPRGDAEAELLHAGTAHPFLYYRRGELSMPYLSRLDSPDDPIRQKVAAVARRLACQITHDAGDEILDW
jgi:hypothetical protein